MKVLIVTPWYLPDGGPSAALYALLSNELIKRDHCVTVISAVPHYPSGRVQDGYRNRKIGITEERGVMVYRIPVPSVDRSRLVMRMAQLLFYQLGSSRVILSLDPDVGLLSNPALTVGIPFSLLSRSRDIPLIFSIHDIYPDVGVDLGIFRHKFVVSTVSATERYCLDRAAYVRVLSDSFIERIHAYGVPDRKIKLIYDWVDTDLIKPLPKGNDFSREYSLDDKFVVMYAGNIGFSQGLEHLLTVAQRMADQADLRFVLVGEGAGLENLTKVAREKKLSNVRFIPFQPRSRLPEVLAAADVSVVMLHKGVGRRSLPSKSFSILASGRPILASIDQDSDLASLIRRSESGLFVEPESPDLIEAAIRSLKGDPDLRVQYGRNGRNFALDHHSPAAAAVQFQELFESALASGV